MYSELKECLRVEIQRNNKPFSWRRILFAYVRKPHRRWYFHFRVWAFINRKYGKKIRLLGSTAQRRIVYLNRKYGVEISHDATIGVGLYIGHFPGVVIRGECVIGKNFSILQNTTIGSRKPGDMGYIVIGDDVSIGANSCIIGNIKIGNNVTIGAMSFVNQDVPDNSIVIQKKQTVYIEKA